MSKYWKPNDMFLLPKPYKDGDSYPDPKSRKALNKDGYGKPKVERGLDRSWTIDELVDEIKVQYPDLKDELKTGIEFAKLTKSRRISVHVFDKGATVADLEEGHGQGVLVILVKLGKKSPKKPHIPLNQVQYELETLAKSGGIKTAHLNCQSLCNKKDKLKDMLDSTDIDVMTVSETKMGSKHSTNSFNIPGYTIMARKDGVSKSTWSRGGVMTYVKNDLVEFTKNCSKFLEKELEAVCIIIELDKKGRPKCSTSQANQADSGGCVKKAYLTILNVYLPPGTRDQIALLKKLQKSMDNLKAEDDCCKRSSSGGKGDKKQRCSCQTNYVILGDFNCDRENLAACKTMRSVKGKKVQTLNEIESSHRLSQLITVPTRVAYKKERGRDTYRTTETLLDLVYTDDPASVLASGVVHTTMSDHYMVYCVWGCAI